jgi:hypothetical protein
MNGRRFHVTKSHLTTPRLSHCSHSPQTLQPNATHTCAHGHTGRLSVKTNDTTAATRRGCTGSGCSCQAWRASRAAASSSTVRTKPCHRELAWRSAPWARGQSSARRPYATRPPEVQCVRQAGSIASLPQRPFGAPSHPAGVSTRGIVSIQGSIGQPALNAASTAAWWASLLVDLGCSHCFVLNLLNRPRPPWSVYYTKLA